MLDLIHILIIFFVLIVAYLIYLKTTIPSNNRDWRLDMKILPSADINGQNITIHNIRNFRYRSVDDYDPSYYDKTFDLNTIKTVEFAIVPFSSIAGVAHTFFSFGFEGGDYVAVSVEIRKKIGQEFSGLKGFFNQYEIMYVVADEEDVIQLRTNYREKEYVHLYPIKASLEQKQILFLDVIKRVNKLKNQPEFYHTITNTCATNLINHLNIISPKKIPFGFKILMPGFSDILLFKAGLIDTDLTPSQARKSFYINDKAQNIKPGETFSEVIRRK